MDERKTKAQLQKEIAERRRAEEALQESEERFHKIFDHSNDQ